MQNDDMQSTMDNLLKIDPATIIFMKEGIVQADRQLYESNHDCYVKEHDANLFALSECRQFLDTKAVEKSYEDERINYITALLEGIDISDQEYHDKQSLPIIYEEDYRYKQFIRGKKVPDNSILSLVYHQDGTPKTYEELLEEKQKLKERFQGQVVDIKTSTTDYTDWSQPKSSDRHIDEIYKLIVASDPILTIQQDIYGFKNASNPLYAKQHIERINRLLDNCPQLTTIYYNEIRDMLFSEIKTGNIEMVDSIVAQNDIFKQAVTYYVKTQATKPTTGSDEYEMDKEMIPAGIPPKPLQRPYIKPDVRKKVEESNFQQFQQETDEIHYYEEMPTTPSFNSIDEENDMQKLASKATEMGIDISQIENMNDLLTKVQIAEQEELIEEETHGMSM